MENGAGGEFLSVRETARILGVHENTIRNWVRSGAIRSSRVAGARAHRFARSEVERVLQDSGASIAPPSALHVQEPELVGPFDLDRWAARSDAKGTFPELIGRMLADSNGVSNVHVRAQEGVAAHGWDGTARASGAAFLPDGELVFELGTDEDPLRKAEHDYLTRSQEPDASMVVFVFCTPRNWPGGRRWAEERAREGTFLGVEVFDAHRLAAWLRSVPRVHQWISERLGYAPGEVQTLEGWWSETQAGWRVRVPAELFLAGRGQQAADLRQRLLASDPSEPAVSLQASSRVEALAFIVAALGDDARSVLVVRGAQGWDRLVGARQPLVLVPLQDDPQVGRAMEAGHRVVLIAGDAEQVRGQALVLPRIDPMQASEALARVLDLSLERPRVVGLARRNMPAFLRWLSIDGRHRVPEWATDAVSGPVLARLLLASSWATSDVEAVSEIIDESWRSTEQLLRRLLLQGDPVFRRTAEVWRVTAPIEAASFLLPWLTDEDVERWCSVAVSVLSEVDPLQDVEGGARLRAQMDGVGRRHSGELRRGIALSMALLASNAADTGALPSVQGAPARIARAVWDAAAEDDTGAAWRRLSEVMPLLAEAAPEAFLDAVEADLARPMPRLRSMFQDAVETDYGFGASSAHTGLLWALESLCWSAEFIDRAVGVLMKLALVDPGGRLINRPVASLAGALLGWIRHSSASAQQKVELAASLLEFDAAVGWEVLARLLPQQNSTAFTPHTPTYADWLPVAVGVSWEDWSAFETGVVSLAIVAADADATRWGLLLQTFTRVAEPLRSDIASGLEEVLRSRRLGVEDRFQLWQGLDELIQRHEDYPDSEWALGEDGLVMLRRLREQLDVAADPRIYSNLFGWHTTFAGFRYDEDGFREAVREAQIAALTDLLARGVESLEQLLITVPARTSIGWTLAELPEARVLDGAAVRWVGSGIPELVQAGAAFLGRRVDLGGTAYLGEVAGDLAAATPETLAVIAATFPLRREVWEYLSSRLPELVDGYWDRVEPILGDWADYREATEQLLVRDHPWAAIALLAHYLQDDRHPDPELVIEALSAAAATAEPIRDRTMVAYYVEQLLLLLEQEQLADERVAGLEFLYFDMLHNHEPTKALFRQLNSSPAMFVEFMTAMFRGDGEEHRDRSAAETAFANRAFSVLRYWRVVPGQRADGTIDGGHLETWVRAARFELEGLGRLTVGDEQIGEILSASPPGSDGLWPAEAVREVIESVGSARMETGLEIGKYNRRGVTTRGALEGGAQERELEAEYRGMAARLHGRWVRTARAVRAIADSYGRDARRNDDRAQLDADRE